MRQVRDWIRLIHEALVNLDDDAKDMMEDTMVEWQQRKRGGGVTDSNMNTNTDPIVTIPLGPGEWDEALGLPLCVVCHHVCSTCSTYWAFMDAESTTVRQD